MNLISSAIEAYSSKFTTAEPEVLVEITRDTHLNVLMPQMLSGHIQGTFLSFISQILKPTYILEIGTFTGYSAICLARGLREGGKIISIEINEELHDRVIRNFEKAGVADKVQFIIGNAMEVIPTLPYLWDMVFIDADKINYSAYYDLVISKVNPGGVIIADNVLWSGKVIDPQQTDKDTQALREFVEKVHHDPQVENLLLPIRDGLLLAIKSQG